MGPGLGGAIGVLFYLGYAVGTSFYIVGFATEIQTTWFPICHTGAADESCFHGDAGWLIRGIGTGCNFLLLAVSWAGAEFFSKFNVLFFVVQMASIAYGLVSFLVPHVYNGTNTDTGEALANRPCEFPKHLHDNMSVTCSVCLSVCLVATYSLAKCSSGPHCVLAGFLTTKKAESVRMTSAVSNSFLQYCFLWQQESWKVPMYVHNLSRLPNPLQYDATALCLASSC